MVEDQSFLKQMQSRIYPNLFILGAAKSATTSIADHLRRFPKTFFCPVNKEPNYFVFESRSLRLNDLKGPGSPAYLRKKLHSWSTTTLDEYLNIYNKANQPWRIDASVRYLYFSDCAQSIRGNIPVDSFNPRFIVCLRKPSSRAKSHYLMMRYTYNLENLNFCEAIDAENDRKSKGWDFDWHYLTCGLYYEQLSTYINLFGRENILILFYENLVTNSRAQLDYIFQFVHASPLLRAKSLLTNLPHLNKNLSPRGRFDEEIDKYTSEKLLKLDKEQKEKLLTILPSTQIPW